MRDRTPIRFGRLIVPVTVLLFSFSIAAATSANTAAKARAAYDTPRRSETELAAILESTCQRATIRKLPLLLEFSAAWCSDCLKLALMKERDALRNELAKWPSVVVNVGDFDEHPALLEAFGVRRIAHWVVLAPVDCGTPVATWPRLAERTLEPASGRERTVTPSDLAGWLERFRER